MFLFNVAQTFSLLVFNDQGSFFRYERALYIHWFKYKGKMTCVSHAPSGMVSHISRLFHEKRLSLGFFSFILSTGNHTLYLAIVRIFFVTRVSKFSD